MKFLSGIFLKLFAPRRDRETIAGDLAEEHALLAAKIGSRAASRWYFNQVLRSVGPLLWSSVRRGEWLKTLGAALVGYFVVAALVILSDLAMARLLSGGVVFYSLVSLAVGFAVMMLGGYLAAWMRPRAAILLAVLAAVMGLASLAVTGSGAPLWYQVGLIIIGPAASLAGGRIRARQAGTGFRLKPVPRVSTFPTRTD